MEYPGGEMGGRGIGNYAVYLNLQNPLEVNCRGESWDAIPVPKKLIQAFLQEFPGEHRRNTLDSADIAMYAERAGYDGVILQNIRDGGGGGYDEPGNVYVAFSPEQIKSADAVTYDDGGDVIPLAERFQEDEDEDDIRYSISESFADEIDAWDGRSDKTFRVGTVSDALKSIGVKDSRIIWHSRKIAKILRKHREMDKNTIKQVPQVLEYPIVVLKSQNTDSRILMFGEIVDNAGKPVTAVMELMPTNKDGRVLNLNVIASAYGKGNIKNFIQRSDLLYLDPDKNRTDTWLQGLGLQLPSDTTTYGSIGTIAYQDGKVKVTGVPYEQYMQDEGPAYRELRLPMAGDDIRYSISESFADEIDAWDGEGRRDGEVFTLGSTGDVLQGLGAIEQDIYLRSEKINTILREHPEMSIAAIRRIPEILDDPVLVLKSLGAGARTENTRLVLFGTARAENGQPVLTVLDLRPVENGLAIDDMQKVNSAYTKDKGAASFVQRSEIMYADEKKPLRFFAQSGLQ